MSQLCHSCCQWFVSEIRFASGAEAARAGDANPNMKLLAQFSKKLSFCLSRKMDDFSTRYLESLGRTLELDDCGPDVSTNSV